MKRWTQEEDTYLKNNYPAYGPGPCSEYLDRSPQAVKSRAMRLGVKLLVGSDWSRDEDKILKDNYNSVGPSGCQLLLTIVPRTKKAIVTRAQYLKLEYDNSETNRGLIYEGKLFERQLDVFLIDTYSGSQTPVRHTCSMQHEWVATPNSILSGHTCPYCSGSRKDHKKYLEDLKLKNILYLPEESYINDATKILHKCPNNHSWSARPNDILKGMNCPSCSNTGFDPTQPAILYYIKFQYLSSIYYKIGVTNRTIEKRFSRADLKLATVLMEERYELGKGAFDEEQRILRKFSSHRSYCDFISSGNTEVFEIDVLGLDLQK